MTPTIAEKITRKLRAKGPGWVFSQRDLASLGSRQAIDVALHRMTGRGEIRRAIRGVYHNPKFSQLLNQEIGPDPDQVAQALARKFGWRISPSGATAENLLGLTTQVPGGFRYDSDGPDRSVDVGQTTLVFKHTALKEIGFKHPESSLIVAALKSVGKDHIKSNTIHVVRNWLTPKLRKKVLSDTETVTGWVYAAIRKICREDSDG